MMQHNQFVSFNSEDGNIINSTPDTFLLFIDETGGESLSDQNYPIFGYGAVGLPAHLYSTNIVIPWNFIKETAFGGKDKPLHAADLRQPSNKQMGLLDTFFRRCAFCRVAAILSDKTVIDKGIGIHHVVARSFYNRITDVCKWTVFDQIFMIFEDSQRTSKQIMDYFSRYKFHRINDKGKSEEVPCQRFLMTKKEMEPGLEVADFVAHTAGASVQSRLKGKRSKNKERQDFDAVFNSIDKKLSSFMDITKIQDTT